MVIEVIESMEKQTSNVLLFVARVQKWPQQHYADLQSLAKSGKILDVLYRVPCYACTKLSFYAS